MRWHLDFINLEEGCDNTYPSVKWMAEMASNIPDIPVTLNTHIEVYEERWNGPRQTVRVNFAGIKFSLS